MATKKATTKRATSKKRVTKKHSEPKSFTLAKDQPPFTSFKFTKQTLYWTILLAFIAITQLWILKIQMDIAELTDAILAM